jgi:hypothetical protein
MSFLIRKFSRAKWTGSDVAGAPIKASVVADCLIPKGSELSVWFAETEAEIDQAKLALLASTEKISAIDVLVIPLDQVHEAGLTVRETAAQGGPPSMRPLHRDIADLDLDNLKLVAGIVQRNIIAAEAEKKKLRLTEGDCKKILRAAIDSQRIQPSELHPKLSAELGYQVAA